MEVKNQLQVHAVSAWTIQGILVERYCFAPQLPVALPPHSHEQYQIGLSLTDNGEYHYRRAYHPVPVGSVSVIHPGEIHGVSGLGVRQVASIFVSFYLSVDLVRRIMQEAREISVVSAPYVPQPIILDRNLERRFERLHRAIADPARIPAEREAAATDALFSLFRRYAEHNRPARTISASENAVRRVREFLDAHFSKAISYDDLARISGVSAFHLSRSFRKVIGVPPHRYQLQRRIDRAKLLLLEDVPMAEIAVSLGFTHQSHFGSQFRRLVGTSPGCYSRAVCSGDAAGI